LEPVFEEVVVVGPKLKPIAHDSRF